jgi:hypothetical protein
VSRSVSRICLDLGYSRYGLDVCSSCMSYVDDSKVQSVRLGELVEKMWQVCSTVNLRPQARIYHYQYQSQQPGQELELRLDIKHKDPSLYS